MNAPLSFSRYVPSKINLHRITDVRIVQEYAYIVKTLPDGNRDVTFVHTLDLDRIVKASSDTKVEILSKLSVCTHVTSRF